MLDGVWGLSRVREQRRTARQHRKGVSSSVDLPMIDVKMCIEIQTFQFLCDLLISSAIFVLQQVEPPHRLGIQSHVLEHLIGHKKGDSFSMIR